MGFLVAFGMRLLAAITFGFALFSLVARADDPLPKQYLTIFTEINDAEHKEKGSDHVGALTTFKDIYAKLLAIHQAHPEWETALVGHRMNDARAKIRELEAKTNVPDTARFVFTDDKRAPSLAYPWKSDIVPSTFWIGEDANPANTASAWNADWLRMNGGADSPSHRNGYSSGDHASTLNFFYVALPFNDLSNSEESRKWVPASWARKAAPDGETASARKDRWVEIKDAEGDTCFAQWEDVGPGGGDDGAYVFGTAKPRTMPAIDVSPAVAEYLHLDSKGGGTCRGVCRCGEFTARCVAEDG
jgi:hypothetical protein